VTTPTFVWTAVSFSSSMFIVSPSPTPTMSALNVEPFVPVTCVDPFTGATEAIASS
jgi:hypothetical protein